MTTTTSTAHATAHAPLDAKTDAMILAALGNIANNPASADDNLRFVVAASNSALLAEIKRLQFALTDAAKAMDSSAYYLELGSSSRKEAEALRKASQTARAMLTKGGAL